jgi:hypothetical protein
LYAYLSIEYENVVGIDGVFNGLTQKVNPGSSIAVSRAVSCIIRREFLTRSSGQGRVVVSSRFRCDLMACEGGSALPRRWPSYPKEVTVGGQDLLACQDGTRSRDDPGEALRVIW